MSAICPGAMTECDQCGKPVHILETVDMVIHIPCWELAEVCSIECAIKWLERKSRK